MAAVLRGDTVALSGNTVAPSEDEGGGRSTKQLISVIQRLITSESWNPQIHLDSRLRGMMRCC